MLDKAQVLLASPLLSFLIQFPQQYLTAERGRTVSLHLNRTAEMQAALPGKSLNYNGTLQLQCRLQNVHNYILFHLLSASDFCFSQLPAKFPHVWYETLHIKWVDGLITSHWLAALLGEQYNE